MSEAAERGQDTTLAPPDPDLTRQPQHARTEITGDPKTTPVAEPDLTTLDDDQLISQRAALRTRIGQLPSHTAQRVELESQYEALTDEFDRRARAAWRQQPASHGQGDAPARRQP